MAKQLIGSYYPNCSSTKTTYRKHEDINGIFKVEGEKFIFEARFLLLIPLKKKQVILPLSEIEKVVPMKLNGVMPFGVCVFLKNGKEYMFGHVQNKKLQRFIEDAMKRKKGENKK